MLAGGNKAQNDNGYCPVSTAVVVEIFESSKGLKSRIGFELERSLATVVPIAETALYEHAWTRYGIFSADLARCRDRMIPGSYSHILEPTTSRLLVRVTSYLLDPCSTFFSVSKVCLVADHLHWGCAH